MQIANRVAAITGAAGGIGRGLALELAERGCDLAISDINQEGLAETAELLADSGVELHRAEVDVSERQAVETWADEVAEHFGEVHFVFNNAGVSVTATVQELTYEDLDWIMGINFRGTVHGTKAFLPHIRRAGSGRVVNISSLFGLIATPTQSAYNASKFAVRGFTESLRAELAMEEASVGASTVHPGGVDTDIARNARIGDRALKGRSREEVVEEFETDLARLTAREAAEIIVDGVRREKGRIMVGLDAKFLDFLQRLIPGSYPEPLGKLIGGSWQ